MKTQLAQPLPQHSSKVGSVGAPRSSIRCISTSLNFTVGEIDDVLSLIVLLSLNFLAFNFVSNLANALIFTSIESSMLSLSFTSLILIVSLLSSASSLSTPAVAVFDGCITTVTADVDGMTSLL